MGDLDASYDAIVFGTGVVESVCAACLSQKEMKVLHFDINEYYGGASFGMPLDAFIDWLREGDAARCAGEGGPTAAARVVPFDDGDVLQDPGFSATFGASAADVEVVRLGCDAAAQARRPAAVLELTGMEAYDLWRAERAAAAPGKRSLRRRFVPEKQRLHPAARGYPLHAATAAAEHSAADAVHPVFFGYSLDRRPRLSQALEQSSRFCVDGLPRNLLCRGLGVDACVGSGVARYLEFQPVEGLYYGAGGGDALSLGRVPCGKQDVMRSKMLSPLEKRSLMRFLRGVYDWGVERVAKDRVEDLNDRSLAKGRSLKRPQRAGGAAEASLQWRSVEKKRLFDALTAPNGAEGAAEGEAKTPPLTPALAAIATHALAFSRADAPASEGLEAIFAHLSALGAHGSTAFLQPLYGASEMPQAFCRAAAVGGEATYVLRRGIQAVLRDRRTGDVVGIVDSEAQPIACRRLLLPAFLFDEGGRGRGRTRANAGKGAAHADTADAAGAEGTPTEETTSAEYAEGTEVCEGTAAERPKSTAENSEVGAAGATEAPAAAAGAPLLVRRVALLRCGAAEALSGALPAPAERVMLVFPPHHALLRNDCEVYGVVAGESVKCAPPGFCLLHLTTRAPEGRLSHAAEALRRASHALVGASEELFAAAWAWSTGGDLPEALRGAKNLRVASHSEAMGPPSFRGAFRAAKGALERFGADGEDLWFDAKEPKYAAEEAEEAEQETLAAAAATAERVLETATGGAGEGPAEAEGGGAEEAEEAGEAGEDVAAALAAARELLDL